MIARLAGRIILLSGWRRALAAFLSGAFATLTQPPFDIFVAGFVSFPVLVWLIDGAIARTDAGPLRRLLPAAKVGWWFGFGYFVSGLWWIGTALLVDADQFAWALPLAVLGLPAFLALFYAFAAMIARLLWSDGLGRILALAFGFALAEWLRTFIFTGFPWNLIGYAAMPVPLLMQSVAVIGLVGMSALAVFVFAAPPCSPADISPERASGLRFFWHWPMWGSAHGRFRARQPLLTRMARLRSASCSPPLPRR